jgi:hypothetical protein
LTLFLTHFYRVNVCLLFAKFKSLGYIPRHVLWLDNKWGHIQCKHKLHVIVFTKARQTKLKVKLTFTAWNISEGFEFGIFVRDDVIVEVCCKVGSQFVCPTQVPLFFKLCVTELSSVVVDNICDISFFQQYFEKHGQNR